MRKRSAHEEHRVGKSSRPGRHILFSYVFQRKTLDADTVIDMPFAPVPETSKLNVADESVLPQMFPHGFHRFLMAGDKNPVVVIRSKALAEGYVVPGTCVIRFLIEPFRNIHMRFASGHVADES